MVRMIQEIQIGDITVPALLSMLGGIFIILGSIGLFAMLMLQESALSGGTWQIYSITYPYWLIFMLSIFISTGSLVMYTSYKMYKQPEHKLWKILLILGSIVSLYYLREFGLGGILGLGGGVMALGHKKG